MDQPVYLREAEKQPSQDDCKKLAEWLPKAEFTDNLPNMNMYLNASEELLRPFTAQVSFLSLIYYLNAVS